MRLSILFCLSVGLAGHALMAAGYPEAEISNGLIRAKLLLPDPERGSYRGTRFDWSGIISSLQYQGHEYFGQWYEQHDPKIHDAITGPVEEYRTNNAGLGYDQAKPSPTKTLTVRLRPTTLSTQANGPIMAGGIGSSSSTSCLRMRDMGTFTGKPCG